MAAPDGYLPYFLYYASISAIIHCVVCYLSSPTTSLKVFSGPQRPTPTALLAHVYGVKNIYTSAIRAYAAYDITNQPLYDLTILTFAGVLWLYVTELAVYRTVRLREASIPFVTSGLGVFWMLSMRSWYLGEQESW